MPWLKLKNLATIGHGLSTRLSKNNKINVDIVGTYLTCFLRATNFAAGERGFTEDLSE